MSFPVILVGGSRTVGGWVVGSVVGRVSNFCNSVNIIKEGNGKFSSLQLFFQLHRL